MEQARLIIDPPSDGAWNMAVDQALLETANNTGLITLRFYQWSEPTLSLGYFQSHLDRCQHPTSANCPLVRRRTGGGAILHDREITYSLTVPSTNRWSERNSDLYHLVHQVLIDLLKQIGADAALYENQMVSSVDPSSPGNVARPEIDQTAFMCFERRSPGDIVLGGYKVVGSAQRRMKNALLQHGSVLLEKSPCSPTLPGIEDLCGFPLSIEETIKKCASETGNELQIDLNDGKLSDAEKRDASNARELFFASDDWNRNR